MRKKDNYAPLCFSIVSMEVPAYSVLDRLRCVGMNLLIKIHEMPFASNA